jgi:low affinity Fe/Cu permease
MVFLIQNMQNRAAKTRHLKLDELIRGVAGARTSLIDLEQLTDEELAELQRQFEGIQARVASEMTTLTGPTTCEAGGTTYERPAA